MLQYGIYTGLDDLLARSTGKSSLQGRILGFVVNLLTERTLRPSWTHDFDYLDTKDSTRSFRGSWPMRGLAVCCLNSPLVGPNVLDFTEQERIIDMSNSSFLKIGIAKEAAASCIGWPFPPRNPPHRLNLPPEIPPVLMVNSLYDTRTPYANAVSVQSQIPGSVLLTIRREGHCTYQRRSSDASRRMDDYLINLKLPAPGTIVEK